MPAEYTKEAERLLQQWKKLRDRDADVFDIERLYAQIDTVSWLEKRLKHDINLGIMGDLVERQYYKAWKAFEKLYIEYSKQMIIGVKDQFLEWLRETFQNQKIDKIIKMIESTERIAKGELELDISKPRKSELHEKLQLTHTLRIVVEDFRRKASFYIPQAMTQKKK